MIKRKTISKKSLEDKLDQVVCEIVHQRKWCEKCKGQEGLQDAHIFSRANKSTRWDLENHLLLCDECHKFLHSKPALAKRWFIEKLGIKKYTELRDKATQIKQWTTKELEELLNKYEVS